MWTPLDRALVGDFGAGQALSDDQYRLLEPFIPAPKPGGRPRKTDVRRVLGGFNWSSQHRDGGWCDGGSATFGSGAAG